MMREHPTTIIHVSDLHFGKGFNQPLWENFKITAIKTIKPDLIVITGDLVNSPWRWKLRKVGTELDCLRDQIKENKNAPCDLIIVPGNHDTRLSGLIPVGWIRWAAIVFILLSTLTWIMNSLTPFTYITGIFGIVALVLGFFALSTNLDKYWGKQVIKNTKYFENLQLRILALDSATKGISGARGQIKLKNLTDIANDLINKNDPPNVYRIAILHHHPLPLPYDNYAEPLMVLDNAGAFLMEMSKQKVNLILHGHKHHHHFSRLSIDPNAEEGVELSVLSTGTPTQGSSPDRFGFNFNSIEIHPNGTAKVSPFRAIGGSFTKENSFNVEHNDHHAYQKFLRSKDKEGCSCKSLVAMVSVNSDGDAYFRREYRKLSVSGDTPILELPGVVKFSSNGHVEQIKVQPLGDAGVRFHLELTSSDITSQQGRIKFSHGIKKGEAPVDFFVLCYGYNAFAMNDAQLQMMYDETRSFEFIQVRTPQIPVESFTVIVRFPEDFKLSEHVVLETMTDNTAWGTAIASSWDVIHSPATIVANLRYPPVGALYKISWQLPDGFSQAKWVAEYEARLDEIAENLCRIDPKNPDHKFHDLITLIKNETLTLLELGADDQLNVCFFAYHSSDKLLKTCLTNYAPTDTRWDWKFKYGDGDVGRAFKTGKPTAFLRQAVKDKAGPYSYLRGDGKLAHSDKDILEGVLLSIPLGHPDVERKFYGVLRICSPKNASKLSAAIRNDTLITKYTQSMNRACYNLFDKII